MEPTKKVIDGYTFELQLLNAWASFEVFGRLCQALGPSVGKIAGLIGGKEKLSKDKFGTVAAAMMGANATDLMEIGKLLLVGARVLTPESKLIALTEDVFNVMFRGKLMIVLKVLVFGVQANFTGFFEELLSLVRPDSSAKDSSSPSPMTSVLGGQPADSSTPGGQPSAS